MLLEFSNKNLLGIDITGDFTNVNVCGEIRHSCHKQQHEDEQNGMTQEDCTPQNEDVNLKILEKVREVLGIHVY